MEENDKKVRYSVSVDTLSLLEEDGEVLSAEEEAEGQLMTLDIIKSLSTEREKFIAIGLFFGFNKREVAYMLGIDPANVTTKNNEIKLKLSSFHKPKKTTF